jgi:hypothetical protein
MSAKFEIHATNDITSVMIAEKYTLSGALIFATEIMDVWDDVHIREREDGSDTFKVVAKLAAKGMFL